MKFFSFLFCWLLMLSSVVAQRQRVTIPIETQDHALALQTDKDQRLLSVYFGKRLANAAEYAQVYGEHNMNDVNAGIYNAAYTSSGSTNLVEPALTIVHADGNTSTELKYVSHKVEKKDDNLSLTSILLRDEVYAVEVTLFYKVYARENIIEQWTAITNKEKGAIDLEKYASANLYLMANAYYLTQYDGGHVREMKPETSLITSGIKSLESKLGTRTNLFHPPTFMLSLDRPATEDDGTVILGHLAWSGNFKIDFERDSYHNLRLIAGINPHASEYPLAPNQTFTTPSFIYAISDAGKGKASRNLHRWARKYRVWDGEGDRMTLLNNWEATFFDFDEPKLVGLFKGAKKLGVDMFLLDDGWFGNKHPRNDDFAGLGDWQENKKKLPHGIGYLVKEAKTAGVKFGIWIETEMVNPRSELYEKHPNWVIKQPERPEHYFRNQLVLDLSNPEVQDFVFGVLDDLLTKNPEIAFIKWDCNAVIYNAHSQYLQAKGMKQSQLYVDYVRGLYKVLERVRAKFPKVHMMLCSGGGGRVDYEAMRYFTEFWLSDNTDPLERIFLQWEYSYYYPTITHCNHVTDWDKSASIKLRTDVAMMGKMGFDIVVDHLSPQDLATAQNAVTTYNGFKEVVLKGEMYRLVSPWENPIASLMFVNSDQSRAIHFNYLTANRFDVNYTVKPIQLKGLDPNKKYKVKEVNLAPNTDTTLDETQVYTGDFLMKVGLNPDITLKRTSVVLDLKAVQ